MADPNVAPNLATRRRKRGAPPPSKTVLAGIRARSRAKFGKNPSQGSVLKTYANNQARAARNGLPPGQAKRAAGAKSARAFAPGQQQRPTPTRPKSQPAQPSTRPTQRGTRTPTPGSAAGIAADPRTRQAFDRVMAGRRPRAAAPTQGQRPPQRSPGSAQRPPAGLPGTRPVQRPPGGLIQQRPAPGTRPVQQPGQRPPSLRPPVGSQVPPGWQSGGPGTRPPGQALGSRLRGVADRGMLPMPPSTRPGTKRPRR